MMKVKNRKETKCMRLYDLTFAWIMVFVSCISCSSEVSGH